MWVSLGFFLNPRMGVLPLSVYVGVEFKIKKIIFVKKLYY